MATSKRLKGSGYSIEELTSIVDELIATNEKADESFGDTLRAMSIDNDEQKENANKKYELYNEEFQACIEKVRKIIEDYLAFLNSTPNKDANEIVRIAIVVEDLKEKLSTVKAANRNLKKVNKQMERELGELNKRVNDLNSRITELETELKKAQDSLAEEQEKRINAENELKEKTQELTEAKSKVDELNAELESIREQLEVSNNETFIDSLKIQLNAKIKELENAQKELVKISDKIDDLNIELKNRDTKIKSLESQLGMEKAENVNLNQHIANIGKKYKISKVGIGVLAIFLAGSMVLVGLSHGKVFPAVENGGDTYTNEGNGTQTEDPKTVDPQKIELTDEEIEEKVRELLIKKISDLKINVLYDDETTVDELLIMIADAKVVKVATDLGIVVSDKTTDAIQKEIVDLVINAKSQNRTTLENIATTLEIDLVDESSVSKTDAVLQTEIIVVINELLAIREASQNPVSAPSTIENGQIDTETFYGTQTTEVDGNGNTTTKVYDYGFSSEIAVLETVQSSDGKTLSQIVRSISGDDYVVAETDYATGETTTTTYSKGGAQLQVVVTDEDGEVVSSTVAEESETQGASTIEEEAEPEDDENNTGSTNDQTKSGYSDDDESEK